MAKLDNMKDLRIGRLFVIERAPNDKYGNTRWLCQCDCGVKKVMASRVLKDGITRSCGCYAREVVTKHGGSQSRLYVIWSHMQQRCENPKHNKFSIYGARGVKICDEWRKSFKSFQTWALSNGYADHLTIDRINSDGDYEPSNCRWATVSEQNANRRPYKLKKPRDRRVSI